MSYCLLAGLLKGLIDYVLCCNGHLCLPYKRLYQARFFLGYSSHWLSCFPVRFGWVLLVIASHTLRSSYPPLSVRLAPPAFFLSHTPSPWLWLSQHSARPVTFNRDMALLITAHQIITSTPHLDEVWGVIQRRPCQNRHHLSVGVTR